MSLRHWHTRHTSDRRQLKSLQTIRQVMIATGVYRYCSSFLFHCISETRCEMKTFPYTIHCLIIVVLGRLLREDRLEKGDFTKNARSHPCHTFSFSPLPNPPPPAPSIDSRTDALEQVIPSSAPPPFPKIAQSLHCAHSLSQERGGTKFWGGLDCLLPPPIQKILFIQVSSSPPWLSHKKRRGGDAIQS